LGLDRNLSVAVASGKGGTGKTTISTCLALIAGRPVRLLDCDVEEPNCHLFLKPRIEHTESVGLLVPVVDEDRCTGCGECSRFCEYNAMAVVRDKVLVFSELCHGCGGCTLACPEGAISEVERPIGTLERGRSGDVEFVQGRLEVGEVLAPPVIAAVKRHAADGGLTIIDAPPGTSCPVIEAVRGAGFVVLVTEPTPFGLSDLRLAVEMVRVMGLRTGVVINRSDIGDDGVRVYCAEEGIPVLAEIPNDRRVAEAYSRGHLPTEDVPGYRARMDALLAAIEESAG